MATVTIETKVSKETYEICTAIANVVRRAKVALEDGWQPAKDIPDVALTALKELMVGLDGASSIPTEFQENTQAATNALYSALVPVIFELAENELER